MQNREARLAAIVYAQVLGFDRLFDENPEEALSLLDRINETFGRICADHRGRVVRSVRDSYLVEFPTALNAATCSIAIQRAIAEDQPADAARGYGLTMGIHVGDVHFLENDAAGEAIVIATKLQRMAHPGSIAVSEEVYGSVAEKLDAPIRFTGEERVEGSSKRLRVYEIALSGGPKGTIAGSGSSARSSEAGSQVSLNSEDFDELKSFVLEQIKRVGRRISTDKIRSMLQTRSPELDQAIEKLADMGFLSRAGDSHATPSVAPRSPRVPPPYSRYERDAWREARHAIRDAVREARHEQHHHHHHTFDDDFEDRGYAHYRERVIERAHKAVGGFAGHLIPFLVVNGFLFFLNLTTGFGFPWFLFPLGGWAIGLISHFVAVGTHRRERAEVEALPENLEESDYKLLRKYHKARASVRGTLGSTIPVAAFLLMVNLITSPTFLWAIFPIAGLFIAIVTSLTSYASRRGSFKKRLKELFAAKRKGTVDALRPAADEEDAPIVREAVRVVASILDQSRKLDPTKAYLGEDIEPLLDNYIGQIRTLTQRGREVEEIMAAIPRAELQKDLSALRKRYEAAGEPSLKREYQKSIDQIERQNRSFEELENQKELLDLRISGSLNSLKQMQIDLARMTGISSAKEVDSIGRLRERSRELSDYLRDFSDGYDEIEGLPQSGEEERKRADQLLEEFKEREGRSGTVDS